MENTRNFAVKMYRTELMGLKGKYLKFEAHMSRIERVAAQSLAVSKICICATYKNKQIQTTPDPSRYRAISRYAHISLILLRSLAIRLSAPATLLSCSRYCRIRTSRRLGTRNRTSFECSIKLFNHCTMALHLTFVFTARHTIGILKRLVSFRNDATWSKPSKRDAATKITILFCEGTNSGSNQDLRRLSYRRRAAVTPPVHCRFAFASCIY